MKNPILIALSVLLFLFQNCHAPENFSRPNGIQQDPKKGPVAQGNGDVYDGKSFVVVDRDRECSQDPTSVKDLIKGRDDGFHLLRENCEDLPVSKAIEMSDLELSSYNPNIIIYKSRAFFAYDTDRGSETPPSAQIFCRGQQISDGLQLTMDVYFSERDSSAYSRALVAVDERQNDGSFIHAETIDLAEKELEYLPLFSTPQINSYAYGDYLDTDSDVYYFDISADGTAASLELEFAWESVPARIVDMKSFFFESMSCQKL